jgi:membrane-bound lytic murein transglycosylase D
MRNRRATATHVHAARIDSGLQKVSRKSDRTFDPQKGMRNRRATATHVHAARIDSGAGRNPPLILFRDLHGKMSVLCTPSMPMRTIMRRQAFQYLLGLLMVTAPAGYSQISGDSSVFPVPEILKSNVEFWTKAYTQLSIKEGLIHDRDYPQMIYKKISLGGREGRARVAFIADEEDKIIAILRMLASQPESTWTEDARSMAAIVKQFILPEAWPGLADRVRFQQGQRERFEEGLRRSGMYLDTIKSIFRSYGIPERVAFLPHVESSFNSGAGSRVGAVGLWQFMRSSGKIYGLKVNYLVDERRDAFLSTIAAARMLRSNYDELQAWPLAITAYNHGLYGMKRAVDITGSRDISTIIQKYESRSFQFASKNFYACFLAASAIAAHPEPYFSTVEYLQPLLVRELNLDYYIRPDALCRYLGISLDLLEQLNPALRDVVFAQQKKIPAGYALRLPASLEMTKAQMALTPVPDSMKSAEPDREQYYRVRRGDNLYAIASHLGVSAQALAQENGIDRMHRIYAGQVLRVPSITQIATATGEVAQAPLPSPLAQAAAASDTAKKQPTPKPVLQIARIDTARNPAAPAQKTPAPKVDTIPAPSASPKPEATVALRSDSAAQLAQAGPVNPSPQPLFPPWMAIAGPDTAATPRPSAVPTALAKTPSPWAIAGANRPPAPAGSVQRTAAPVPDSLREILAATAVTLAEPATASHPALSANFDADLYNLEVVPRPDSASAEIRISLDETIGHYADWLGVSAQRIRDCNHMGRNSDIVVGRTLILPVSHAALNAFVNTRLEYHMALEEDFYSQYKVTDSKKAQITKGQNLWDICNGEEPIPLWLFKKYNKQLDLQKLMPGTEIVIPVIEEKTEADKAARPALDYDIYRYQKEPSRNQPAPIRRVP